jgi:hypothetical protein
MTKGKYAEKARSRVDAETRYQLAVVEGNHLRRELHELRKVRQDNTVLRDRISTLEEQVQVGSSDEVERWKTKAEYWRLHTKVADAYVHLSNAIGKGITERVLDDLADFKVEGATPAQFKELMDTVLTTVAGEWIDTPGGMDGLVVSTQAQAKWLIRAHQTRPARRKKIREENERLTVLTERHKEACEAVKRWTEAHDE